MEKKIDELLKALECFIDSCVEFDLEQSGSGRRRLGEEINRTRGVLKSAIMDLLD